jgi:ATP-dependent Zn protease
LPFFEKSSSKSLELLEATQDAQGEEVTNQLRINITNEMNAKKQQEREQVAALTQLLVEIDGVQSSSGILVLGATNRSNMLDPALTRPGRFSKIISLPLPEKKKRIEVFQIHSAELGWESDIPWDYLAQRTKGFSAGDLATVANQSAIQAILNDTKHSLKTFEQAITMLTTYPSEKKTGALETTDPYYYQRDVYYKVGQAFYHYHENVEGKPAVVELTSRQPNPRHYQILANVNQDKYRLRTRLELENLLASLLSGKAGEVVMLLTLNQPASFYWESDLAKNDLYEATKLVMLMLQDWYLYSGLSHLQQQKFLTIPENQNALEYRKNEEVFSLFEETVAYVEQQLTTQFNFSFSQSFIQKAQWKADIIQEISNVDSLFAEWSRFHLPDPQETERNPEWIPPEEYYHDNETKRYLTAEEYEALQTSVDPIDPLKAPATFESLSFAELALIERDRYAHTILVNSFNKALLLLEKNREVVDTLAYYLSKNKILRSFELENLMKTGD